MASSDTVRPATAEFGTASPGKLAAMMPSVLGATLRPLGGITPGGGWAAIPCPQKGPMSTPNLLTPSLTNQRLECPKRSHSVLRKKLFPTQLRRNFPEFCQPALQNVEMKVEPIPWIDSLHPEILDCGLLFHGFSVFPQSYELGRQVPHCFGLWPTNHRKAEFTPNGIPASMKEPRNLYFLGSERKDTPKTAASFFAGE